VVAALKSQVPSLEGPVIRSGENRLKSSIKFNINGYFYFDGMDFKLKPGDRIALLTPATGDREIWHDSRGGESRYGSEVNEPALPFKKG